MQARISEVSETLIDDAPRRESGWGPIALVPAHQERGCAVRRCPQANPRHFHLTMQGTFELTDGEAPLPLQGTSQRLFAYLALQDRTVSRAAVAGTLWPEASESNAHACLRSALARLNRRTREAVDVDPRELRLAPHVVVDFRESRALAQRLVDPDAATQPGDLGPHSVAALSTELLPDWYDDWVTVEAEDWRQLRLHALEALAERLAAAGRHAEGAMAALAAISAEPLRESAQASLIRVHLAEGNQSEALRSFARYREMLRDELGLEPTPAIVTLIQGLRQGTQRVAASLQAGASRGLGREAVAAV